jgi:hypothetical protein
MRILPILAAAVLGSAVTTSATAQCPGAQPGADVIVGAIPNISNYGQLNGMAAYALGTTSCNTGTQELLWFANNTNHPVIGQNIYRLEEGRFEQVGMSWLKHGFTALQQNLCCNCQSSGTGSRLGVGCSDPYSSGLNGSQSGLGPRWQVNAFTGAFSYPYAQQGQSGDSIFKRIQVPVSDVLSSEHPTAQYFGEAQYIAPDDAAAGNGFNNVSWCRLNRGGGTNLSIGGGTVREQPAIYAWQVYEPSATITEINVPGEGQFVLGQNVVDLGNGTWRYEFAIFNNNSHFSGESFSVPVGPDATLLEVGHSFPHYHSGEPYTNASWDTVQSGGAVTWSTEPYIVNQNANALRWGTTYSFWFTSNGEPTAGTASLGLFRPGNPGDQSVSIMYPGAPSGSGAVITNYCDANPNSTAVAGVITASNVDQTTRTMDLEASNLPVNANGYFLSSMDQGFTANPGGSAGNLCIGGSIGRGVAGGVKSSGSTGTFTGVVDLDAIPTGTGNMVAMAGQTWYFQAWHRDSLLPGFTTSNFTDGVSVLFF